MGYSTTQIDIQKALKLAQGKEIDSASQVEYFNTPKWKRNIARADIGDNNRMYFTLNNGDFVEVNLAS